MKKIKKRYVFLFIFSLFFGILYWNLRYNLPKTIETITGIVLGTKIKSSNIEFYDNKIKIENFSIETKEEIIIYSPIVDVEYSLKELKIKKVSLENGEANITRDKDGDMNIVTAFIGKSKKETKEETPVEEEYTPGISIPIDEIVVKNFKTTFRDNGYRLPIKKEMYNTNGLIKFSKTQGINMEFSGENQEEKYNINFSTENEPYSVRIRLNSINVDTTLIQYGYDGEEVNYENGKLNMDLIIAHSGLKGWITFNDVDLRYIDLDETIDVVKGRVDFNDKGIFLESDIVIFGKKDKFYLKYENNQLDIDFDLDNLKKENIQKLSYLDGIELPLNEINIDKVKFNLNYKNSVTVTIDVLVKHLKYNNILLDDNNLKFVYDTNGIHIKNYDGILSLRKDSMDILKEKINFSLDFKENILNTNLKLKNLDDKFFIPDIENTNTIKLGKDKIDLDIRSNIVNLKGSFDKKNKILSFDDNGKYHLKYSIDDKKIIYGDGKIPLNYFNTVVNLSFKVDDNNFEKLNMEIVNNNDLNKKIDILGNYNLNNGIFDFDIDGKNASFINLFDKKETYLNANFTGSMNNKNGFDSTFKIENLNLKFIVEIKNFFGDLQLQKKEKLYINYSGEIGEVNYRDYSFGGIGVRFRIKDDKFQLKKFQNSMLDISGEYNINTKRLDFDYEINNLKSEKLNIKIPEFNLGKNFGKIKGSIENPILENKIEELNIYWNDKPVKIVGKINLRNKKISLENFKINNSRVLGKYDIDRKKYEVKINLLEEELGKYYIDNNLKYRVLGECKINGDWENINVSLKSTVDKIYIRGNKLPKFYIDVGYNGKIDFSDKIKINEISANNSNYDKLLFTSGYFDIGNKYLELKIPEQIMKVLDLQEYIKNDNIQGEMLLSGVIAGKVDSLEYRLKNYSKKIKIYGNDVENIKLLVEGNFDKIYLKNFSFEYMTNKYISNGEYGLKDKSYIYNAKSNKINLNLFKGILSKYKISNIDGDTRLNMSLRNDNNSGYLYINNLSVLSDELGIALDKFGGKIVLKGKKLYIEKMQGILNTGEIQLKGGIELPTLNEIQTNPYFRENLDYSLTLLLNRVKYSYKKDIELLFNSDLKLEKGTLLGNIDILEGEIREIPNTQISIFKIIVDKLSKFISPTVNESEKLGKDFEIKTVFENDLKIDIKLRILDKIKLNIGSLTSFVDDIKGELLANLNLKGENGKYNLLGNVEVVDGSLELNNNLFTLERCIVNFNNKKDYLPKLNPSIILESKVESGNEEIGFSLFGEIQNLNFSITSDNGVSSGNLNSLLLGNSNIEGENNQATATLITNLLGGQLTQVLKPVSDLIKNVFNISKFKINSSFITESKKNDNENGDEQRRFKIDAVLEAEDNIYKDKVWWVAKATLLGEEAEDSKNEFSKENKNNTLKEYDVSLEYRFDNTKSIGIGVGKLPEDKKINLNDEKRKKDLNYHIDFKFKKRYYNIIDIFLGN